MTKGTTGGRKMGEIYEKIAMKYLTDSGIPRRDAKEIVEIGEVDLSDIVRSAIHALEHATVKLNGTFVQEPLERVVFYGHDESELESCRRRLSGLTEDQKGEVYVRTLAGAHNGLIKSEQDMFFAHPEERWQFVPIYMMGLDNAKQSACFIEPLLEAVGIKANGKSVKMAYKDIRSKMFGSWHHIKTVRDIKKFILSRSYMMLGDDIIKFLREHDDILDHMACMVRDNNPDYIK